MHTQAALIAFAGMFGAAASALYFGIKATRNRQPGVPYFPGNFQSPFNILFRPGQLTDAGKLARRNCLISLGVFLIGLVAFLLIGVLHNVAG